MADNNVNVENNGANNTSSTNNQTNSGVDYGKLEEIINKGINQKENSILKSYFSQQGLSEDEMKEAIANFKNSRKSEEEKNNKSLEDLTNNYSNLQKQFNQERLNNALNLSLMKKGLSEEQIPFISKMVEVEGILNDKSEINQDKLNENIEKVFKAFPNLVQKEDNKSFVQVGVSNNNSQYEESSDALLRKAFGLKDNK
jgi:hypothetical protein